ncbi:MAG: hypothetical protein E6Q75_04400 [Rheinheimera sp.]|nr:MAG: hypothetical protein E6Q75_04400 [Rheinheimera sp.]
MGIDEVVPVFVSFFRESLPKLSEFYNWRIPQYDGFSDVQLSGYDANVRLKHHLAERWARADHSQRLELANFVVAKWGGVRANKPDTIEHYVHEANKLVPATPLQGIASYSKIFAIAAPDRYAIYDARVAACLNAIQLKAAIRGIAFRYVSGRNLVVGHAGKRVGFVYQKPFTLKALKAEGWLVHSADQNYPTYLKLLELCAKELGNVPIYQLEMVLFALAEEVCEELTSSLIPSNRH